MDWNTVIWSRAAGICLALAGAHLLVWLRVPDSSASLAFAICAVSVGVVGLFELLVTRVETPAAYGQSVVRNRNSCWNTVRQEQK